MANLPTSKSVVTNDMSRQVFLIYGRPKIGKSTFCSNFDSALYIATEPGLEHLSVFKMPVTNWEEFLETCFLIGKGEHEFKTIIIDTIDNLVSYCADYVCRREKITHPSDLEWGKGWGLVTLELHRVLTKLSLMPYGLVMIGHSKVEEQKTKTKSYNKETITITGENRKMLLSMADIILFMDSDIEDNKEIGVVRTKPSIYYEAGDRSKLLPERIVYSLSDPNEAFLKVKQCFKK